MAEILAYCGYVGVTMFYPLQLYSAFTRRNLNLGLWPMISLVIGLALLGASFWMTGILAYKLGNSIGLTCAIVLLALKVKEGMFSSDTAKEISPFHEQPCFPTGETGGKVKQRETPCQTSASAPAKVAGDP